MLEINITTISSAIIISVFLYYIYEATKLLRIADKIKKANENEDELTSLTETKLKTISTEYSNSISIETQNGKKTNTPSSEFFSEFSTAKAYSLNLRALDACAGTLVGLGLLGTFLGLTMGVSDFDSTNTANIQKSIQALLDGMGTAFFTSLLGMGCSIVYTFFDKRWKNKLTRNLFLLTEKLDNKFYIDDVALTNLNQTKMFDNLHANIKQMIEAQFNAVNANLVYQTEEGKTATIGNAIREILTENTEQSKALKSFSADLAIELNNGFDEILSREMQKKIVPLMENIDTTTKEVVEHIDSMASLVSSPATDIIENMVSELKASMSEIIAEFNRSLSGSATSELESLAIQLGTAGQAMADFPNAMANISSTLQVTIEEVKHAVTEISNTSANANSTAMQQMQEQITFATGAISTAIGEVKEVMSGMSQSSQEQSNHMVSKLADAAEKMGTFLNSTVSNLSSSVQASIQNITDDMSSKQANLISLQEDTTEQTRKLLDTFNQGLDRLEKMNEYITSTMDMFQKAQGHITGSTAHLQNISSDMKLSTELFNKSQIDYNTKMENIQRNNQTGIESISKLMKEAGEVSDNYIQKFEIIKIGLGGIFEQLQSGLTEYSKTVQTSTQKYLNDYAINLTSTTDALASTIQQQNEMVEMLTDALNSYKRK